MGCDLSFSCFSTPEKCGIPKEDRTADGRCPYFANGHCSSKVHNMNAAIALVSNHQKLAKECCGVGAVSDGAHSFNDLYEHRDSLFGALCLISGSYAWKSREHSDGSRYDGYFIAGLELPSGQISYHIPEKYYLDFPAEPLLKAPEWDGHTPKDVVSRLHSFWDDSISDLYFDAIQFFGKEEQVLKAIEELAELIRALSRKDKKNITEEMADVTIMLNQLVMIYGNKSKVNKVMCEKRDRLYRRIHGKKTINL